ncbi:MAG: DUF2953 domain-containing protein [Lachnospiraceae bacterium]|nr:DUF2953 domain-containing protein [Lachnospiraceae bacterium]
MSWYLAGVPGALKVIGIILLCIILLVLLAVCLILFVPIRFYLDGTIPDTDIGKDFADRVKTTADAKAGFHWLFHAVCGQIAYPGDLSFTVKALWFTLMGGEAEAETTEAEEAEEKMAEAKAAEKPAAPSPPAGSDRPSATASAPVPEPEGHFFARVADFIILFSSVIADLLVKPYEVFFKIQYTISRICDKISDVRMFLDSETFDRAKAALLKQTVRLLKGIDPKRCDIRVRYGTGDPALTADILAAYSVLYPVLYRYMTPEADFDGRVFGVSAHVKGRITLFRVLTCAGIVYFNRDVRASYNRAKKLLAREEEGT